MASVTTDTYSRQFHIVLHILSIKKKKKKKEKWKDERNESRARMYVNYVQLVIQRDRGLKRGCLYDGTFFPLAFNGPSFSSSRRRSTISDFLTSLE